MIETSQLTKRYGDHLAVDDLSFRVEPGRVTGFLGPNGAGKSTTMRLITGLDRPTSGTATVNGRRYADAAVPMHELGVLLDAKAADPARSARNHLRALAAAGGVPRRRVEEVLDLVGLTDVADRPLGGFSLGMGQRLGIATALLGDPQTVMLDEPVNGLDVDGIQWIRRLLTDLAAEGRTVLLSSHLMSELELVAEHLVVIGRGRILADTSMADFLSGADEHRTLVRSPEADRLARMLAADGVVVSSAHDGEFEVRGVEAVAVGRLAAAHGIELHQLATRDTSLEEAYLRLTQDAVSYAGHSTGHDSGADPTSGATSGPSADTTTTALTGSPA
ncbi:ATP-binding cassette domain-containing protein [Nocardioides fonticola]|uniref:ATP-binding cassette domain-containing protein n=1 Tax=Nocardioides fonticola TaxID=450363 RepID=A0ABP7XCR3_9ACTN